MTTIPTSRRDVTTAVSDESQALLAGATAFLALGVIALLLFAGRDVPLGGPRSAATAAGLGGAFVAVATFVVSARRVRRSRPESPLFRSSRTRRLVNLGALAIGHGLVAFLLWLGLFTLLQQSFVGAVLYPFAAAVTVGAVGSATAYVTFHSATRMDAYRLATLLAVFLIGGMLASMLTASDPYWWQDNLSALGKSTDASGYSFNITLILAGALVTALAGLLPSRPERRGGPRPDEPHRHPFLHSRADSPYSACSSPASESFPSTNILSFTLSWPRAWW